MADITTGLLSHWKLDESGSTTTAVDSGPLAHDLTLIGFLSPSTSWSVDEGLYFAGTGEGQNDEVTASGILPDYTNQNVTITARIKRAHPRLADHVIASASGDMGLWISDSGTPVISVYDGAAWVVSSYTAYDIEDSNWHSLAMTWEDSTGAYRVYVDGSLEIAGAFIGTNVSYTSGLSTGFHIGALVDDYESYGNISNVRVYNRVLSIGDIQAVVVADDPDTPVADITTDLEGWWKLDESGPSITVKDSSSANHNMVLTNLVDIPAARSIGNGTYFDGLEEFVLGESLHEYYTFPEFTIAAWVKMDSTGRSGEWIVGSSNDLGLYLHWGGVVTYVYHGDGRYTETLQGIEDISDTDWHHIASTWSNTTGILRVFLDGTELRSADSGGEIIRYIHGSTVDLVLARWFKGSQADSRWYSRVLADIDISQLANSPPIDPIDDSALVAEWLFNEASGGTAPTIVYDSVGGSDLAIVYDSAASWVDNNGRGLDFTSVDHAGGVWVTGIPTNAPDISTALGNSCQKVTLVVVAESVVGVTDGGHLFVIGSATGNGELTMMVSDTGQCYELRYAEDSTGNEGFRIEYDNTDFNGGPNVFVMVVDTTEAILGDRIKFYKNGILQLSTNTSNSGSASGQNSTADFTNSAYDATLMNRSGGIRECTGAIHYAALFNDAISATQAYNISAQLLIDNDDTLVQPHDFAIWDVDGDNQVEHGQPNVQISLRNAGIIEGLVEIGGVMQTVTSWTDVNAEIDPLDATNLSDGYYDIIVSKPKNQGGPSEHHIKIQGLLFNDGDNSQYITL